MKKDQGFSLVELLIVVAIIAIIAAIAVPSLLTSRQAANEAGAIQGCRTIGSAELAFSATQNQQFGTMQNLIDGNFLDARFTGGMNGYQYAAANVTGTDSADALPTEFGFNATPVATSNGRYTYGVATDQVVRWGEQKPASVTAGDPIGRNAAAPE